MTRGTLGREQCAGGRGPALGAAGESPCSHGQDEILGERPWSEVSTALEALLDHPDDGGDDLLPAPCASILIRLEGVTDQWARGATNSGQPLTALFQHRHCQELLTALRGRRTGRGRRCAAWTGPAATGPPGQSRGRRPGPPSTPRMRP
ncbi:hypothetical protein C9J60_05030 [Streptomyces sp. A244]|nr:hypothetical protein C9J60_05030 [Streptomyces sp. A244]